ncbi:MAG: amidohydrolase family protein [Rhodothermaceae bacterium]|nr:amidohydrolase family protein [Rhodothermaceae bacterium]
MILRLLCSSFACSVLLLAAWTCDAIPDPVASTEGASESSLFAFVDVSVIPMDSERVLDHQTVVVRNDRIVAVGPVDNVAIPDGAERLDGQGQYLVPGLAEMHGHVPPPSAPAEFIEQVLFLYLANGITTVRGMLGAPGQLDLRARANSGALLSPTLYLAGPSFNGGSVSSPAQAEAMVREQHAEGWNLLKVHPGLSRAEYDAMARTANDLGIRFGGHVPADVGLAHALDMGQETFDHVDGYVEYLGGDQGGALNDAALAAIVRRTREAGAAIVPTMALWEVLYGTLEVEMLQAYPELLFFPPNQVQQWANNVQQRQANPDFDLAAARRVIANRMRVLRALHEGGVTILMGTDAPQLFSVPGFSLHRELERMAEAGMSPYAILQSGTANVGAYFANEDTFGHVAEGHRADLLLVAANPLDDIAHLQQLSGVMVRGRWVPGEEIERRLDTIARSHTAG